MAEFDNPDDLLRAAEAAREAGYRKMDGYSPYPVHGLAEILEFHDWRLPWMIFIMGVVGCASGYFMQYYTSAIDYPWNVGGKPYNSWPQFIPITYELTILFAAFTAGLGMLALNGLPRPYHPVFNVPRFERASSDLFFLCIESKDGMFDIEGTAEFLTGLGSKMVSEVPR